MNGQLVIIDGEPGFGKTLEAIRLMLESAHRKKNIITNVAVKPLFIKKTKQIWNDIIVLKPTPIETKEFWKYVPPGGDIYIDEAHLIWPAAFWKEQRQIEFMEYISQFRKAGDTVYLMAQNYENVDNFIRQRATKLYSCRRLSWPSFFPAKLARQPIIFFVNTWSTSGGERSSRIGWPRFYTPGMCHWIYQLYDTRGTVDIPLYDKQGNLVKKKPRPTWKEFMPTILTEQNAQSEITGSDQGASTPPAATPTVTINTAPPADKPKRRWKHWAILAFLGLTAAALAHKYLPHKTTRTASQPQQHYAPGPPRTRTKLTYYGTMNNAVIIGEHHAYANWPIGTHAGPYTLEFANVNGVTVRGPHGTLHHRPWWTPPKEKSHHKAQHATSPTSILH